MLFDSSNFTTVQHIMALAFFEIFLLIDILLLGVDKTEREIIREQIRDFKTKRQCKK